MVTTPLRLQGAKDGSLYPAYRPARSPFHSRQTPRRSPSRLPSATLWRHPLKLLLRLYRETGDAKYIEPLPRALAYYRKCVLPDGKLARFYELKTNKPLYFTKDYKLTYDDSDMPTHYSFKISSDLDAIAKEYEALKKNPPPAGGEKPAVRSKPRGKPGPAQESLAKAALAALDDKGRWVEKGTMRNKFDKDTTTHVIDTRTFLRNINTLSTYLAASKP